VTRHQGRYWASRNQYSAAECRQAADHGGPLSRRFVLEQIAFGSTRPILAALGERGYAVEDRVYKSDSTELQSVLGQANPPAGTGPTQWISRHCGTGAIPIWLALVRIAGGIKAVASIVTRPMMPSVVHI
jgi:hypothetical protein